MGGRYRSFSDGNLDEILRLRLRIIIISPSSYTKLNMQNSSIIVISGIATGGTLLPQRSESMPLLAVGQ